MNIAKAIKFLTLAIAALASMQVAFSQDKRMIDDLCGKNIISKDEASKIARDLALVFPQKDGAIKTKV